MKKLTHIVILTPLGLGGRGGIDRLVDELRDAFYNVGASKSFQIRVLTTRGPGRLLWSPFYLAVALSKILVMRVSGRIDVAHISLSQGGSTFRKLIVATLLKTLRVPYVIHLNGSNFHQFWDEADPWLARAIKWFFSNSAGIVVTGSFWARYISAKLPTIKDIVVVLPNATRAVVTIAKSGNRFPVQVLFLGHLGFRKGVPQLLQALASLAEETGWRATLAGDGAVEETRSEVARLGIADRVTVLGWQSADATDGLLKQADILVLPSFDENLPMSVIEGFAHGLAVVCTPVGAIPDIVEHEKTGLLVTPGDSEGLAEAVRRLMLDSKLRETLGRRARQVHAERLEIEGLARKLLKLWADVATRSEASR